MDGFDAEDHFDEILETILQCKSVQKCSVLAKRGSCTQTQIQAFLKALIDAGRTLTIHGLSISDHHYNGAMKDLNAYEYKGHHLTFFSNCAEPSSGPDLALVCEKNNGPAVVVIEKTTENQLFHTKFLGNIIRSELQQQKLSSMTMIRITGHFAFDEDVLVVNATIAGSETPLKEHFFDCKRVEKELRDNLQTHFERLFKFRFGVKIDASNLNQQPRNLSRLFLKKIPSSEPQEDAYLFFEGPLNMPKIMDTLTVMRPLYRFMNRWFRKTFPAYKFKFTLTPEAIPEEPRRTWSFREMARNFLGRKTEEEVSDDSQARPNDTQWYEGPLKDLKAKDTLVVYNTTREMRRDVHDYARDTALINEILARRQEMIRRRRFEY
ncbi:hypothetical protein L596_030177 [Steinernema carpocapsae]|uniref:Uncharacterized protein n=1 Tax=Steinernema carpocapsae TaxID=34508 RepID=A0A4U5LRY3_STECR|nr:hypothetical protein L596_030177 [Steinernema carpocapsae]